MMKSDGETGVASGSAAGAVEQSAGAAGSPADPGRTGPSGPDIREKGRLRSGESIYSDRRLFVQLQLFGGCRDSRALAAELEGAGVRGALYEDLNDPAGVGVLAFDEDPGYFLDVMRPLFARGTFPSLRHKPDYTMTGRTYSMGWEPDLVEALVTRPTQRMVNPELRWAVWYPIRRSGAFEELSSGEQHAILSEHGSIGHSFGRAGIAYDIRLACHGLNTEDNDFVIAVLSRELYPLSAVIQRMRKTRQTARHLTRLGPFFAGRVIWQASGL